MGMDDSSGSLFGIPPRGVQDGVQAAQDPRVHQAAQVAQHDARTGVQAAEEHSLELDSHMADLMARGKSLSEIASEVELAPADVRRRVQDFLNESYGAMSVQFMRMMQMRRLEMVLNALWDQAITQGDTFTEGRQTANVIQLLSQLTELMDLKRDRLKDEQVELTRAQAEMVHEMVAGMRMGLLERLLEVVRWTEQATGDAAELRTALLAALHQRFPSAYAEAAEEAAAPLNEARHLNPSA